jgi:hypothetical protein
MSSITSLFLKKKNQKDFFDSGAWAMGRQSPCPRVKEVFADARAASLFSKSDLLSLNFPPSWSKPRPAGTPGGRLLLFL